MSESASACCSNETPETLKSSLNSQSSCPNHGNDADDHLVLDSFQSELVPPTIITALPIWHMDQNHFFKVIPQLANPEPNPPDLNSLSRMNC